jgi:putative chitinase
MAEEQKNESKEQLAKSLAFLKVGAKNFLYLKGIARDLNVASQNIQLLLKAVGGEPRKSGQTDMHILTPDQIDKKLEVDVTKASLITGEEKSPSVVGTALKAATISKFKKSAIGKKAIQFSSKLGLAKIIPRIIGLFTKIALAKVYAVLLGLAIVKTIVDIFWENIVLAWDSFTESVSDIFGSIKEAASNILESISNLFTKETFDEILSNISDFFKPVTDIFKNIYDKVYNFILKKVDDIKMFFAIPIEPKKQKIPGEDEVKAKAKEEAKKQKPAEKPVEKPAPAKPASAPGGRVPAAAPTAPTKAPEAAPKEGEKPLEVTGVQATIVKSLNESGVTSPKAHANVLATVKAESNFKVQSENLNYSSPQRIMDVFGKRRIPSAEFAEPLVKNPEALANEVYKTTDGNSAPGDGFKYRGRGFIQHTGKNQYAAISKFTGADVLSNPDLLNSPDIAAKAIPWFLLSYKKLKPDDVENMSKVNKAIAFSDPTGKKAAEREASSQQIYASMSGGSTGGQVASASTDVASGQRQQAKPSAPVIINASTTNNTKVQKNETVAVNKPQNTAGMLAARAT